MITVYVIKCSLTSKKYVGSTSETLIRRWCAHKSAAKGGETRLITEAIRQYGAQNFTVTALDAAKTQNEADVLERKYIAEFGTLAPDGWNATSGGMRDFEICEIGRDRMRSGVPRLRNDPQIQVVTDLVKRMRASGRTRIELARSAGISERQIYYLMSGRNKSVGADMLCALAGVLGCQVVLRKAPATAKA